MDPDPVAAGLAAHNQVNTGHVQRSVNIWFLSKAALQKYAKV